MENSEQQEPMQCQCGGKCHGKWHHKYRGGHGGCMGGFWFVGWLFTIGFLKLAFWKGVLALVIWPYYMGVFVHGIVK